MLKQEYVALGAHYDHVGLSTSGTDRIYNGADDDGSGTVALLNMAEALVRGNVKTRRSWLFVWHAGEEKGLWGSRYFVEHPTVPLDKIVVQLNVDMIGRSRKPGDTVGAPTATLTGPNEIYVIGSKMMSSALGALSERVNKDYLDLSFNYKYDDPSDPEPLLLPQRPLQLREEGHPDHLLLRRRPPGLPPRRRTRSAPSTSARWSASTRTIYATAYALAELPTRPAVDRQLPAQLSTEP